MLMIVATSLSRLAMCPKNPRNDVHREGLQASVCQQLGLQESLPTVEDGEESRVEQADLNFSQSKQRFSRKKLLKRHF